MTATLVLATVPHLKEIADLLRRAAEESNSAFHERKLRRLVTGFEGLVQPFECIASSLDVESVAELIADGCADLQPTRDAEATGCVTGERRGRLPPKINSTMKEFLSKG
jgi:hypothetical protein